MSKICTSKLNVCVHKIYTVYAKFSTKYIEDVIIFSSHSNKEIQLFLKVKEKQKNINFKI